MADEVIDLNLVLVDVNALKQVVKKLNPDLREKIDLGDLLALVAGLNPYAVENLSLRKEETDG